jgi:hypothetical protein
MGMKKVNSVVAVTLLSFVLTFLAVSNLQAEVEIKDLSTVFDKATLEGEVNLFYRYDKDPWFGVPLSDLGANESGTNTNWGETDVVLRFGLTKNTPLANITAKVGVLFNETIGQDVYPAFEDTANIELEQAWLKFGKIVGTPIDLTLGRQNIKIEKTFVVGSGFQENQAALWFGQPDSFAFAVRADGDFGPLKTTLVWARDRDYGGLGYAGFGTGERATLTGMNLHYDIGETANVYGGVFAKNEENADYGAGNENDSINYDLGVDVAFGGLHLEGEYVLQKGETGNYGQTDRDARSYFASATYQLNNVPLAPYLQARYAFFSGDDPNTAEDERYDFGFATTPWLTGALGGEAQLQDSNKKDLVFTLGFLPTETIDMRVEYIVHRFDEQATTIYGPLSSDKWSTEVDLFVDWFMNDNLFVEFLLGTAKPDDAAKEALGDEDAYQAYCFIGYSF